MENRLWTIRHSTAFWPGWKSGPFAWRNWPRATWTRRWKQMTPAQRERARQRLRQKREWFLSLPPERRQALRERGRRMSPEQRQRARQRWRQATPAGTLVGGGWKEHGGTEDTEGFVVRLNNCSEYHYIPWGMHRALKAGGPFRDTP